MRNSRCMAAACLFGGLAGALAATPAQADAARDLMGRVPSVAELVEALSPAPRLKTRGIRPAGAGEVSARTSRPAVDLEVRFEFDSATLTPMAQAVLDNLATALTSDLAAYRFVLEGHTDAVGSDHYNLRLSQLRAQAVQDYLHELYRIDAQRLTAVGKGEDELLLPDQPTAAPNRRVRVINQG
jgi:outer membrane protein OmpA-like peptidoglycan-associated protein